MPPQYQSWALGARHCPLVPKIESRLYHAGNRGRGPFYHRQDPEGPSVPLKPPDVERFGVGLLIVVYDVADVEGLTDLTVLV